MFGVGSMMECGVRLVIVQMQWIDAMKESCMVMVVMAQDGLLETERSV